MAIPRQLEPVEQFMRLRTTPPTDPLLQSPVVDNLEKGRPRTLGLRARRYTVLYAFPASFLSSATGTTNPWRGAMVTTSSLRRSMFAFRFLVKFTARGFVAEDRAVALQHAHRKNLVDHN